MLRTAFVACLLATNAWALDYPSTCRGPGAVVTDISGEDSRFARMTAKVSPVDATQFCKGEYATGSSMSKCVADMTRSTRTSQANCFAGTLTNAMGSGYRATYKFPIAPTCGGDNQQAIAIFKMLCPSFKGEVEE